jgi:carbonic anhydrase
LYRQGHQNNGFIAVDFNDVNYNHKYGINRTERKEDIWTGTSYQVRLDYRNDFWQTSALQLLEPENSQNYKNYVARGIQFHFHSPSEHTIDGKEFKLELHIVHKLMYTPVNDQTMFNKWRYAVTGVMFDTPVNPKMLSDAQIENMEFLHTFMKRIATTDSNDPLDADNDIDLQKLMGKVNRNKRWIYRGSFTTPPAAEGVFWNVIDDV